MFAEIRLGLNVDICSDDHVYIFGQPAILIFLAVLRLRDNISASDILCVSLSNYNGYLIR